MVQKSVLMIQSVVITIFCATFLSACSNRHGHGEPSIQQKIEEDLNDGLSTLPKMKIDETGLPSKRYVAEMEHSSIEFRTSHWEIVDLIGWFERFEVVMYSDSTDFSDAVIFAQTDPSSIVMPSKKMQGTVRNPDYLDAAQFPMLEFRSSLFEPLGENKYLLTGEMEIKGIKKEIQLDVTFNGFAYPGEKDICGFTAKGGINRSDFGVAADHRLHSGRLIHNELVEFTCNLRME